MNTEISHQYCFTCGHILGQKKVVYGYNEQTGQPLFYVVLSCPNYKWWRFRRHPLTQLANYWSAV